MNRFLSAIVLLVGFSLIMMSVVEARSFSCSFGEPACLDFGAKVCRSSAKCVSDDAVCFDSFTCNYSGFICKSKYNSLIDKYKERTNDYNDLVDKYNKKNNQIELLKTSLVSVKDELDRKADEQDRMERCLDNASSLEEAKGC